MLPAGSFQFANTLYHAKPFVAHPGTTTMRLDGFQRLLMAAAVGIGAAIGIAVAGINGAFAGIAVGLVVGAIVATSLSDPDQD